MGLALFLLFAVLEIALVIWTCKKEKEKKKWRRNRTISRAAQLLIVIVAILLPFGQKWRLVPVLSFLIVLMIIAALVMFIKRKKEDGDKKVSGAVISCVLSVLLLVFPLMPAFIFTGYKGLPTSGEYGIKKAAAILIDSSRTDPFEDDGSSREVPVHFYYPDCTAEQAEGKNFPLIIFDHGSFGYYQSNTSLYMELASNGYVVVSLDHPHYAFFTKDTDGNIIPVDMEFIQTAVNTENGEYSPEEEMELAEGWVSLRRADENFVLDTIKSTKSAGSLGEALYVETQEETEKLSEALAMVNTEKIGLTGHSIGGAMAAELGRTREDISAAVDIDGTLFGEIVAYENDHYVYREEPYPIPLLLLDNESHWQGYQEKLSDGSTYINQYVLEHAKDAKEKHFDGTAHMDFTDLPLLSPFLAGMFGKGSINSKEFVPELNSIVLNYFNFYLKGEGTGIE